MSDLREFVSFDDGVLTSGDLRWPVPFKARVDKNGEIEFEISPLVLTDQTFKISQLWHEEKGSLHYFGLSGSAVDGTRFQSATVYFNRLSMPSDESGARIELQARCNLGTFTQAIEKPLNKLAIRECLRGFECFRDVRTQCPLGELVLAGVTPLPEDDSLSGWIHLICHAPPTDPAKWREDALKLFEHIRNVMSFAESRTIKASLRQTWMGDTHTAEGFSQTRTGGTAMQVFHHLNLQPIFNAAVASFFSPPIAANKLYFAIEWFAMRAVYSETRLLNAMTALENLTNANLDDDEKLMIEEKRFDEIARLMRNAFTPVGPEEKAFRAVLAGKMQDLNRRPLREKIEILAKHWKVPLHDLPPKSLGAAITARNEIVHRGHYYDDDTEKDQKASLWGHILIVREVVVRLVLAALGFKGRYISFLGGYHDADYPPSARESFDDNVTAVAPVALEPADGGPVP